MAEAGKPVAPPLAAAPAQEASVRELPLGARVRVLTWNAGFLPATATALASLSGVTVLRTGPSDWCLVREVAADADGDAGGAGGSVSGDALLRLARETVAADASARVVDVSHALCAIEVAGAHARELLAKGCGLDLHPRAFAVGSSARTRFANVAAILLREGNEAFRCYVARSHRDYVVSWLNDAAAEWPGV